LGQGGLGTVWRVEDRHLQLEVAAKVLHLHLAGDPDWRRRLDREARLLASLAHPGIPAVHDLNLTVDGVPFYTMGIVVGEVWATAARGGALRRRVGLLAEVADAVGWAHAQGVIHRDLSPYNVIVAADGRARVIDWGLARRDGGEETPTWLSERAGTPGYTAPEVYQGRTSPRSDVYALGALLGEAPDAGQHTTVDEELSALSLACRDPDPSRRPPHGAAVAQALRAWLDGERRRARAAGLVDTARTHLEAAGVAREEAARALAEARAGATRDAAWDAEDRSREAELRATSLAAEGEALLHIALHEDTDCEHAHEALTQAWRRRLLRAEETPDPLEVLRLETQLRSWRDGRYAALADSAGQIAINTLPTADWVRVERYTLRRRRLVPEPVAQIQGPSATLSLAAGSYRLIFRAGRQQTLLTIRLRRDGAWTWRGADGAPWPVPLAPSGLGPEDCYVPGGWYTSAPDPGASDTLAPTPFWLRPYVLRRHPVTVGEWSLFLHDLRETLGEAAALAHGPTVINQGDQPTPAVRWREGRIEMSADGWRTLWPETWPVSLISQQDALAYAAWLAKRTGLPWRLPTEQEWEHAGRGDDGRVFPWGDHIEPGWTCNAQTESGPPSRAPVGSYPLDESPYGVQDLSGNVREWCSTPWEAQAGRSPPTTPLVVIRGGAWTSAPSMCRLAMRFAGRPGDRLTSLGMRLARFA
jgi:serine/threonine-protein kinase